MFAKEIAVSAGFLTYAIISTTMIILWFRQRMKRELSAILQQVKESYRLQQIVPAEVLFMPEPCPVCKVTKKTVWNENVGHYDWQYKCEHCGTVRATTPRKSGGKQC